MDRSAILAAIRAAGVVGQGGAGFPAHVKYDARASVVIANGCECEPLLFTDQTIMAAQAADVVRGLCAVMDCAGAERGVVAIKAKYAEAARALAPLLAGRPVSLLTLDNFYPAGDEQVLVREALGRSVPPMQLPRVAGAVVANVGTLSSVSRALTGTPVTDKLLTVSGEVARPSVLRAPLGTALSDCLAACGGPTVPDPVYLVGGPMMGRFLDSAATLATAVVTKTCGGLLVLPRGHFLHQAATLSPEIMQRRAATACIQCRYCTDLCPRHLLGHDFRPHEVMRAFAAGGLELDLGGPAAQAAMCCECGVCELYACPMRLSPRRINALVKARLRENVVRFEAPKELREEQVRLRPWRKIPVPRLGLKIGLEAYLGLHPAYAGELSPDRVRIPLSQHVGAPAVPLVVAGERVAAGQCVGEIPDSALGARVHASIAGVVRAVDGFVTIEGDARGRPS
jgi:Na+-translocating ferredoxin:NAD+ oxidoreductase RnfC subunit